MLEDTKYLKFASDIFWGLSIFSAIAGIIWIVVTAVATVIVGAIPVTIQVLIGVFTLYTISRVLKFLSRLGELVMVLRLDQMKGGRQG